MYTGKNWQLVPSVSSSLARCFVRYVSASWPCMELLSMHLTTLEWILLALNHFWGFFPVCGSAVIWRDVGHSFHQLLSAGSSSSVCVLQYVSEVIHPFYTSYKLAEVYICGRQDGDIPAGELGIDSRTAEQDYLSNNGDDLIPGDMSEHVRLHWHRTVWTDLTDSL